MYTIKQNEPEGWMKAFYVLWNDKHVATFRYKDAAEAYVKDDDMGRVKSAFPVEHESSKKMEYYPIWDTGV